MLKLKFLAIAIAIALLPMGHAGAAVVTYSFDTEFSGAVDPAGTTPWVVATFADSLATPGAVLLTIDTDGLTAAEFVGVALFNIDPSAGTLATFNSAYVSGENATFAKADSLTATNKPAFKADGDGFFDFSYSWGANDFTMGEEAVFLLTSTAGNLTASDFQILSIGAGTTPDGLYAAVHIQGIEGGGSGWASPTVSAVPIPGAAWLFGSALMGLVGFGRLRRIG